MAFPEKEVRRFKSGDRGDQVTNPQHPLLLYENVEVHIRYTYVIRSPKAHIEEE